MATCTREMMRGTAERKGRDTESWTYLFQGDSIPATALEVIDLAHATGPDPVPVVGTQHPDRFTFVQTIDAEQTKERRDSFKLTVNFGPPEPGEDQDQQSQPNPLNRPPVYDVQYVEQEYVIAKARNVDALGDGPWARAANTLGPIVNGALHRPDEPQVDTTRNAVLTVEFNVATLGEILQLNEDFQLTTNSDTVNIGGRDIAPRRLKFLCARSLGRQQEGEVVYYPCVVEIEVKKTTDLVLDNTGYEYWDADESDYVRAKDSAGEFAADPVNLTLTGELADAFADVTQLTYRYLEEVAYAGFFS